MNLYSTLTVADKLTLTLEGLMRAVAACSDRRRPGGPMAEWLIRLGDGTAESHSRAQHALDRLWAYTGEMFEPEDAELVAAGVCVDPPSLRLAWNHDVDAVLMAATLQRPRDGWMQTGGRLGQHTEHLGHMLAEMQHLQRSHPGAVW